MQDQAAMDDQGEERGSGSLSRGLAILRAMYSTPTYISLRELHELTRLPKPSIVRLLERLIAEGYVTRTNKRGHYRPTAGLSRMVKGWDPVWAAVDAVEHRPSLLANYRWPVAIGTRDGTSIVVLHSTRQSGSPNSFRPSTFGARAPLLTSAMGMAYIAHCEDGERRRIAAALAGPTATPDDVFDDIVRIAIETRARGYGLRLGSKGQDTSVAVPIFGGHGELVGVLVVSSFATVTSAAHIQAFAHDLTVTAGLIHREIRRSHDGLGVRF